MNASSTPCYRERIEKLVDAFPLSIDKNIQLEGRPPTSANSEFLTNKEQGDWAEKLVTKAINDSCLGYVAVPYGRSESIAAGDPGFADFYRDYQNELNRIGKKPDILLFRTADAPHSLGAPLDDSFVERAVAAIEVRSSSFLCQKYKAAMEKKSADAERRCVELKEMILREPFGSLLRQKNQAIHDLIQSANAATFREISFRAVSWWASEPLRHLSDLLKELKGCIEILHKRDYLSITPKLEDIALVNRWISRFGVPHFYLQVFFDRAYMISFEKILSLCSDSKQDGSDFTIEKDVKNQGKTTVKVNIDAGEPVIGRIDMPSHFSAMKELDRGRLLFYVKFDGGQGYLDVERFRRTVSP